VRPGCRSRALRHEQVVGVGAQTGHQADRRADPCFDQGLIGGRIGLDDESFREFLAQRPATVCLLLDDDVRFPGVFQLPDDLLACEARAADDVVILEILDFLHSAPRQENVSEVHLDQGGCYQREPHAQQRDAAQQEEAGEYPAPRLEIVHFLVSYTRQRDDGHVDGIGQIVFWDLEEPHRADQQKRERAADHPGEPAFEPAHPGLSGGRSKDMIAIYGCASRPVSTV
jgi:hypothetical protein